jgi:hypothetical protein
MLLRIAGALAIAPEQLVTATVSRLSQPLAAEVRP